MTQPPTKILALVLLGTVGWYFPHAAVADAATPPEASLAAPRKASAEAFIGKWAMRMHDGATGWLSIEKIDGPWEASLWMVGQTKVITNIAYRDGKLTFTRRCKVGTPEFPTGPATGKPVPCHHVSSAQRDKISIEMRYQDETGANQNVTHQGKRLPPLPPKPDLFKVRFGEPIELFNGSNLDGWRLTDTRHLNGWKAVDGALVNTTPKLSFDPFSHYGNLRTDREFTDFNLTIEFNVPPGGNSGVYLRGMYEAQVVDRDSRMQGIHGVGAIFNRIEPTENAGKVAGEWQAYDITLVDRHATVILNGKKVIDNQPIAGCTNGALHADETMPGPLYLQGDHTAVSYRNIVIRPVIGKGAALEAR